MESNREKILFFSATRKLMPLLGLLFVIPVILFFYFNSGVSPNSEKNIETIPYSLVITVDTVKDTTNKENIITNVATVNGVPTNTVINTIISEDKYSESGNRLKKSVDTLPQTGEYDLYIIALLLIVIGCVLILNRYKEDDD